MRRQTAPIPKATLAFFGLSAALGTGGGIAYYYLGAATTSTVLNIGYRAVNLGRKLDYILGKATGSSHNIQRSQSMLRELERVGLPDSPATRQYLTEHLTQVARQAGGITQANGRVVKESLLMGPGGASVKLKTVWEGTKLITVEVLKPK